MGDMLAPTSYTNSLSDENRRNGDDEKNVRSMYEYAPYPDLKAGLKSIDLYLNPIKEWTKGKNIKFLDAGCGTGHYAVGVAKKHKNWSVYGIDLSTASLKIASKLMNMHKISNIKFKRGSYIENLPFEIKKFDIINALGTIHHTSDPLKAMINLRRYLTDDGYMFLHLYGYRCDQGKFDMKEMLSILEPNLKNYEKRFELYSDLIKHRRGRWLKRVLTTSPFDVYVALRNSVRNLKRKLQGVVWSPGWTANYPKLSSPWIDHFCHPCERAYEVQHIKELVEKSGFKVVKMLKQGKSSFGQMPDSWKAKYEQLNEWDQWRLNELLAEGGGSFALILRKNELEQIRG